MTVDDHALFRQASRALIDITPGFESVGEAASGAEALTLARDLRPDLVLLDVRMEGLDGIETARRLSAEHPLTVIVLVTIADDTGIVAAAASCGAAALVRKQDLDPRMLHGLWVVHRHR